MAENNESAHENSLERKMKNIIQANKGNEEDIVSESDLRSNIEEFLYKYEKRSVISLRKSSLEYWKERSSLYIHADKAWSKEMCNLAKKFLTPTPTSADVERLFSTCAEILNKRRNRLSPHNAEMLLFCHENIVNVNYNYTTS